MNAPAGEERLLRVGDVSAVVGVSRAHIYHLMKQGSFPRPIALSRNCARWVHSEIQSWVRARIDTADRSGRSEGVTMSGPAAAPTSLSAMAPRRGRPRGRPSAA